MQQQTSQRTPCYLFKARADQLLGEVREKDLICLIEGAWTERTGTAMQEAVTNLSSKFNTAGIAVSGDGNILLQFIKEAAANQKRVYLGGFSLGCDRAEEIAKQCYGCPIEILFLLDGTRNIITIPRNVKEVLHIKADYLILDKKNECPKILLEDKTATTLETITLPNAQHLDIPERAFHYIYREFEKRYA
ncbi:MAG: hypothetical protein KKE50_03665 [Nanoarchaeota archaeon]|nr:hypothetical protein [Nanoarchaeota archaeon]